MQNKEYLMIPGPTPVPQNVLNAMSHPMFGHRTPRFAEMHKDIISKLQKVLQTRDDIFILTSSGTGGMEAAAANTITPGDKILTLVCGKFGERWSELGRRYGAEVIEENFTWGKPVNTDRVKELLNQHTDIKAVFATLNETSTGVINDIETLGSIISDTPALLVVDAISGAGGIEVKTSDWNIDILVTGSQKAMMMPPGLAVITVSQDAWKVIEKNNSPCYYFDLLKARKSSEKYNTPYTPAISLFVGLNAALDMLLEEGMNNVYTRHKVLRDAVREAANALGLQLMAAAEYASPTITSIYAPSGIGADDIRSTLKQEFGISFAGGQAQLKNKIFRIAHMGYTGKMDIITAISGLEMALSRAGYPVELGLGIQAAEKVFLRGQK
ncbi:MAG: alanine--glyoxylate aminotransferase family protein [Clostridiales bacterium]|nr:alanine--glyoxylate aminotransferase family protein [Clostridiales bacterium]MCF8023507.1 alanine--glyoxylate aminotransferase family protein [Clostridiales bacterium]